MKLTVKEAAERACVSAALVYQWCEEKRLPHYRMGQQGRRGKILIDESDLDAFLASLKVMPAASPPEGLRHIRLPAGPLPEDACVSPTGGSSGRQSS